MTYSAVQRENAKSAIPSRTKSTVRGLSQWFNADHDRGQILSFSSPLRYHVECGSVNKPTCTKKNVHVLIYKKKCTGMCRVYKTFSMQFEVNLSEKERVMVFHVTFNNISAISCGSVLLVKETGVPEENHRPTLSHNVVSSTPCPSWIQTHNVSGDRHWSHR